ncbi:pro-neuregulin-1, membrane-bound isoform-like isoform X2 [Mytilus trossulus]|uniref:pro-neuregulin-1, membrane-bound isoform-like isoform X2 n=1 Tax=Mytilus trossulus TaxID=6551 RepID=UPI0030077B5A
MKLFRFRFIILGLLLCIFHVWCRTCGTFFTDPASSTYLANIVIEGIVTQKLPVGQDFYRVVVKVTKVRKGDNLLPKGKRTRTLVIGEFSDTVNYESCIPNITSTRGTGQKYFFFLKNSSSDHFVNSAFPVLVTKKTSRAVRKSACRKCDKAPSLKTIKVNKKRFVEGRKFQLSCRIRSARPPPEMLWEKNGKVIKASKKGFSIKKTKRGIVLRKRKATLADSGTYVCESKNVVGKTRQEVKIEVKKKPTKPPKNKNPKKTTTQKPAIEINEVTPTLFYKCPPKHDGRCFNGGTCEIIADLGIPRCRCPDTHTGERCEQRRLPKNIPAIEDWDQKALENDRRLTIIGIVIGILVFVCICIASYLLAKRRRNRFFRRQAEKRQQNNQTKNIPPSYSKLPSLDEVSEISKFKLYERVTMNHRETQTDETSFVTPNPHTNLNLYLNPMDNEDFIRNAGPRRNSRSRLSGISDGRRSQPLNGSENHENRNSSNNNMTSIEPVIKNEKELMAYKKPKVPKFSEGDLSSDEEQIKNSLPSLHISEEDQSSAPLVRKSNQSSVPSMELSPDSSPKRDSSVGVHNPVVVYTPTSNSEDNSEISSSSECSSWSKEELRHLNKSRNSESNIHNDSNYSWNERGSPELVRKTNRRRSSNDLRKNSITNQNEMYSHLATSGANFHIYDLRDDDIPNSIPV